MAARLDTSERSGSHARSMPNVLSLTLRYMSVGESALLRVTDADLARDEEGLQY